MPRQCTEPGCTKQSTFALAGDKASRCKAHATEDMIDVCNKRCTEPGCTKRPTFALAGDKASRCKTHATKNMVDVINQRCAEPGCRKHPTFGITGDKASRCKAHATEDMIDVKSKRCAEPGCTKQPVFALAGDKPSRCKAHATKDMIDVCNKRCTEPGCDKIPNFALAGDKASRCKTHATKDMIDVKSKRCSLCSATHANPRYKPLCARCHFFEHPDDPRLRNFKTKEQSFTVPLQQLYPDAILDSTISGGCSRRRPDFLLRCPNHDVLVEVDEDQHASYGQTCEDRRLLEIMRDLGSRPLMVIRLNPDSYYDTNGQRVRGCFSMRKGELVMTKVEHRRRFAVLEAAVSAAVSNPPERDLDVMNLFMDAE